MTFDAAERVTHVVQPSGFWLTFGYDLADRRTSVTDSAGGDEESTYDLAGQLRRRSAGYGWTDFYYDADGREIVRLQNHKIASGTPGGAHGGAQCRRPRDQRRRSDVGRQIQRGQARLL